MLNRPEQSDEGRSLPPQLRAVGRMLGRLRSDSFRYLRPVNGRVGGLYYDVAVLVVVNIVAALYFLLIAANVYVTRADFVIRNIASESTAGIGGQLLGGVLGGGSDDQTQDANMAITFIRSWTMLEIVEKKLHFSEHYHAPFFDIVDRLGGSPTREEMLAYFRDHVQVSYSRDSGMINLTVKAFTPEFSRALASLILTETEREVNDLSGSLAQAHLEFVEKNVRAQRDEYLRLQDELFAFQRQHKVLSDSGTQAQADLISKLQAEIVATRSKLDALRQFQTDQAPAVQQLQGIIKADEDQIATITSAALNADDPKNAALVQLRKLTIENKLAEESYRGALASAERARSEAANKLKRVLVVSAPFLPDEAELPNRLFDLFSCLVYSGLALLLFRVVLSILREHAD